VPRLVASRISPAPSRPKRLRNSVEILRKLLPGERPPETETKQPTAALGVAYRPPAFAIRK
jgi:hypothetical protein